MSFVKFYPYYHHIKYKKLAYINFGKHAVESDYSNNKVLFKNDDYIRYKADVRTVKVIRSGKYYKITIKNIGNKAATKFKVNFWYGTQRVAKETLSFTIPKFGAFGKVYLL
ncbi:hypothetical protein ALNOE001_20030 [Candidatus Methanobinarius endosymbioticus]|uniref:Uncharacterized protein n=1 Tax=Candidatus Methanobinarius endosymbioticus TaxID=2006182 RepID=A0A366M8W8_9EURY|nr:hypothetical protein ALNOE001_20030 [Candidatus Methanobinarius endosymbioticus]